jgi:hypothetical protein
MRRFAVGLVIGALLSALWLLIVWYWRLVERSVMG